MNTEKEKNMSTKFNFINANHILCIGKKKASSIKHAFLYCVHGYIYTKYEDSQISSYELGNCRKGGKNQTFNLFRHFADILL